MRSEWAGDRDDSEKRLSAAARAPGARRCPALRGRGGRNPGITPLHQRPDPQGAQEAAGLPRVRPGMHARAPAWSDDGVRRGGVRRVLQLWSPSRSAASRGVVVTGPMARAILRKCRESMEVKSEFFQMQADRIAALCQAMATAFQRCGRQFVMGNGGSSCDAQHVAVEFTHPIIEKRRPLPAIALTTDAALLTAIGNDRDFSRIFSDQIRIHGRAGDMALGISTSGQSPDVIYALQAARNLEMTTIGFAGMDGGKLPDVADHSFVVPSFSIHRIQETHVALLHMVWDLVHVALGEEDVI